MKKMILEHYDLATTRKISELKEFYMNNMKTKLRNTHKAQSKCQEISLKERAKLGYIKNLDF